MRMHGLVPDPPAFEAEPPRPPSVVEPRKVTFVPEGGYQIQRPRMPQPAPSYHREVIPDLDDPIAAGLKELQPAHATFEDEIARAEQIATLVDECADMRQQCKKFRIDVRHLPEITQDAPEAMIRTTHKTLRSRLRGHRYVSVAEDAMLEVASVLGDLCDGSWALFGDFRPDLRTLRNTLNMRLPRIRTSTQSGVTQTFGNMSLGGPWGDVAMEWATATASTLANAHRARKHPKRQEDQARSTNMRKYAETRSQTVIPNPNPSSSSSPSPYARIPPPTTQTPHPRTSVLDGVGGGDDGMSG